MDPKQVFRRIDPKEVFRRHNPKDVFNRSSDDILIGAGGSGGLFLNLAILKTHLHVIGLTGTGKSFFLELLARELMHMRKGFCLIDPLGFLYDSVVNYIAYHPEHAGRVVFFDPGKPSEMLVGYNPLKFDVMKRDASIAAFVRAVAVSLIKVFKTDPAVAQRLNNTLQQALMPTVEAGLTPYELFYFFASDTEVRNRILARCSDHIALDFWRKFDLLPRQARSELLGSLENRVVEFTRLEMIKTTLGQTRNMIDVSEIMEKDKILLVRLAETTWLSKSDGYVIGTLLVNDLYHHVLKRTQESVKRHPFYLIIDEFQRFLTPDVAEALDACRQKGLHLILAHQHLGQLVSKHVDPETLILDSVLANAKTKVIFGTYPADAKKLAEFFAPEWNLKELKHRMHRTTVLNYELERHALEGWGHVSSTGDSVGSGRGASTGGGVISTESTVSMPDDGFLEGAADEALRLSKSVGEYESAVDSWNEFSGSSYSESDVSSSHEALLMRPILGKEIASEEFWTYQEKQFQQAAKLMSLETQHALVKVQNHPSMLVKIKTVVPYPKHLEKIAAAFEVSKKVAPDVYLTYDERLLVWQENQRQLQALSSTIEPMETKIKEVPERPQDLMSFFAPDEGSKLRKVKPSGKKQPKKQKSV